MEQHVIIPSPPGDFVELARTREYTGQHWRKHILNLGELIHPKTGEKLPLDDKFYSSLANNFERGVCDIVQAPVANDDNKHVETPLANGGEVMGISREGNKVYVDLDVRDPRVQEGLKNKTILGASAFLHMDYTDTRTGRKVGPTLLHSCFTNRPYVVGLDDYEPVIAATADSEGDVVVLAQEEAVPTKDELITALKEHGIDVEALQAAATQQADMSQLTAMLTASLGNAAPAPDAGTDEVSLTDVIQAVGTLSTKLTAVEEDNASLRLANAEAEVDGYVRTGRVMPKQRNAFVKLAMSDREQMAELLPDTAVVKMSDQAGAADPDPAGTHETDVDAEIARLSALMASPSVSGRNQK
jgi:hypothetical protein